MAVSQLMAAERRWIVWKFSEERKKLPVDPQTKKNINSTDPDRWLTYSEATAITEVDGVGFVMGDGWSYVDLDDSIVEGQLTPLAATIVKELDSYTEISPSGTGLKIIVKATLTRNHARKGLEVKGYGGYTTITGRCWPRTQAEPQERGDILGYIIAREFGAAPPTGQAPPPDTTPLPEPDGDLIEGARNVQMTSKAGALRRLQLDDDEIIGALRIFNAKRCRPPLDDAELESIVRSVVRYSPPSVTRALEDMNDRHAVCFEGGKTVVLLKEIDTRTKRTVYQRSSFEDIRNFYQSRRYTVIVDNEPKEVTLGHHWLNWPGRREYDKVVFDPESRQPDPRVLNLWTGFAVRPAKGDWSRFRSHIKTVLCQDNAEADEFFIRWLARMFQKPGRPAETAIAVKGVPGCGKSIVGRVIASILGPHALHVTHAHHVVGHFNAHLQSCVFLFADEAISPNDKQGEAALKTLITEPIITVERKGKDAFTSDNCVHAMFASNDAKVIPAGLAERRYLMLEASEQHANDRAYFAAIMHEMQNGGRAAMLHDLLALDLTGWNHTAAPKTSALHDQQTFHLDPLESWWFGKLQRGEVLRGNGWPHVVPKDAIYDDYVSYCDRGSVRPLGDVQFWVALRNLASDIVNVRKRVGKNLAWWTQLGTLTACRAKWDKKVVRPHQWDVLPDSDIPTLSEQG